MAQRTVSANSTTYPAGGAAAINSTNVGDLNTKFSSGNTIEADHMNKLRGMLNNAIAHYHNYTDMYSSKTYGNTGHSGDLEESKNSTATTSRPSDATAVAVGEAIQATRFNQYANLSRFMHSHTHSISDRIVS
jgi:hypothetical protein